MLLHNTCKYQIITCMYMYTCTCSHYNYTCTCTNHGHTPCNISSYSVHEHKCTFTCTLSIKPESVDRVLPSGERGSTLVISTDKAVNSESVGGGRSHSGAIDKPAIVSRCVVGVTGKVD